MYIVVSLLVALITVLIIHKLSARNDHEAPGPLCLPVIGSMWAMRGGRTHMHVSLTELAKKWGPIYRLRIGTRKMVVLTDPELIRQTFASMNSPAVLRPINKLQFEMTKGRQLMANISREHYAVLRKACTPMNKNLPGGTPIPQVVKEELEKLCKELDKQVTKEVHLNPLFMFFTRNVFLRILFRKSWSFDTEVEEEKSYSASLERFLYNNGNLADFIPMLEVFARKYRNIAREEGEYLNEFSRKIIRARKNDPPPTDSTARDFLDMFLMSHYQDPVDVDEESLVNTLRQLFLAATFTVSDTLDWMVMFLCKHPHVQEMCHQEIKNHLNGRLPAVEDAHHLPYLDNVIKETFRLRPPAPLSLFHKTDRPCTIGGYSVEVGTVVVENLYGIGNLEKYYEDADKFNPDRWQTLDTSNLMHFGYGPTMCLGMPTAKQELFLAAASLLQRYQFFFAPSNPNPDFTGEYKVVFAPKKWFVNMMIRPACEQ